MSSGGRASYVKGAFIVSRSCVPMATRVLCRARFWCSLSWRAMKDSYLSLVNFILRSIAPDAYGRRAAVCYAVRPAFY